jgi:hypothetical protein
LDAMSNHYSHTAPRTSLWLQQLLRQHLIQREGVVRLVIGIVTPRCMN